MSVVAFERNRKQASGAKANSTRSRGIAGCARAVDRPRMGNRHDGTRRCPVLSAWPAAGPGLRTVCVTDRGTLYSGRRIGPAAVRASKPRSRRAAREGSGPVHVVADGQGDHVMVCDPERCSRKARADRGKRRAAGAARSPTCGVRLITSPLILPVCNLSSLKSC